jgi:nucleoside transporter
MPLSIRVRLSFMMFLNYVIWGAWYVTIVTYLTVTLKFSDTEAGSVFATGALASMISPFFVGLFADRFFSSERVLAVLHLIGAVLMYSVTLVTSFSAVYAIVFAYCLCYYPTVSLTNSLTFRQISDPGRDFPLIRVFATLGWIAIGLVIGHFRLEASKSQFLIAAGASLAMSIFSLALPHTPPPNKGQQITVRRVLGLDALVMLKDPSFLVFVIASILACIPLTFYFSFTNAYLNDVHVTNSAGKMALGQVSEVGMMLLMPLAFRRVSVKMILLAGLAAWTIRYALLAYGNADAGMWMFYAAILLHGICYDFFFMTGQLYTDMQAPPNLRGAAQGLIIFLTYGVGMFIGSMLSGVAGDYYSRRVDGVVTHDWQSFWLSSSIGAFVILLAMALLFRSNAKVQTAQAVA